MAERFFTAKQCPMCGSTVRLHSSDEGTSSYERVPTALDALLGDLERERDRLRVIATGDDVAPLLAEGIANQLDALLTQYRGDGS
jgi:hypothetical protein